MATTDTERVSAEYKVLTEGCGLVDRSERGKLALIGAGAIEFLNGQVTNELAGLRSGEGCYAAFLTHKGKMLGDLRILVAGNEGEGAPSDSRAPEEIPSELLLDTERVALQALFDMIRRFKVGYEVQLHKRTLECGLLSLVGPHAEEVTAKALASGAVELGELEHSHRVVRFDGMPVRLARTDVGIDAIFDASANGTLRNALEQAGAVSVSEAAAEIVRVENERPRFGVDIDESTIPQEAGLNERAVSFTKGCYVGQETVARLHYKGKPNRRLCGLRLSDPAPSGAELRLGERPVGRLGSSVLSPAFGPIGLALVRREAEAGASLMVGAGGASALISELPFNA